MIVCVTRLLVWLKRPVIRDLHENGQGIPDTIKPLDHASFGMWLKKEFHFLHSRYPCLCWLLLILMPLKIELFRKYNFRMWKNKLRAHSHFQWWKEWLQLLRGTHLPTFSFSLIEIWKVVKTVIWIKVGRPNFGQTSPLFLLVLSSWCE